MASEPIVVQAIYSFKGKNNDELCFKKGDKITVTQKEDGGWWEGTLSGKTGWFPSNYVQECKDVQIVVPSVSQQDKVVVLKDLIDSEKAHVAELKGLVTNFLQPLEKSGILTADEYKQLTGNIIEVLDIHQQLLNKLEAEESKPSMEQRVGRLFLTLAPKVKSVHQAYCSLHPRAVCILDRYKDKLTEHMESCGAASPGVLVLTTNLSKPFRRLEKYSAMLQELERYTEENHPDRGDTQRSVAVYRDIAATCSATRRQKDLELLVLTGEVQGWEGQNISSLGEIIYMRSVAVGPQHNDRYFVLFPSTLLILSVGPRTSSFIYEGKLPLSGIKVMRLEDNEHHKNAFELSGPMIEKRLVICQSREEANHWVELLQKYMPNNMLTSSMSQKISPSQAQVLPQPPPHMSPLVAAGVDIRHSGSTNNSLHSIPPFPSRGTLNNNCRWSASCLRPAPPLRPCLASSPHSNGTTACSSRKPMSYKEDAMILDIIETYCSSVKPRSTVNSVDLQALEGKSISNSEKNISEQVYLLNQKVKNIEHLLNTVSNQLAEERSARCFLQAVVKKYVSNCKESEAIDWPLMENSTLG